MDGKKLQKIVFAAATALVVAVCALTFGASGGTAYANSAQRHWSGTNSSGVGVREENCPLEVESEILTFDIQEFPKNYYAEDEPVDYNAHVTAEYRFYNPADYDVTATLVFPFGQAPSYLTLGAFDKIADKYDVKTDGETVASKIRHTYYPYYSDFKVEEIARIRDDYDESGFYRRDLPVTAYTFRFSGIAAEDRTAYASILIKDENSNAKYIVTEMNGSSSVFGGTRVGGFVQNGDKKIVYVLGSGDEITADRWTIYKDGGEKKKISGDVTLESVDTLTFADLVFDGYDETNGISRVDWYNALTDSCKNSSAGNGTVILFFGGRGFNRLSDLSFMRWYEYEITVPAGGRVTNTVTAPVFPAIDMGYSPGVYTYNYLLSPASTWAKFGTLDVRINTPFYIYYPSSSYDGDAGAKGWTTVENGYTLNYDALPDGELRFVLCSSESPSRNGYYRGAGAVIAIVTGVILLAPSAILAVVVIFALIYGGVRKKKREKNGVKTGLGANKPSDYFGDYGSYPDVPQEKKPDRGEQAKTDNPEDGENKPED